jgi:hypothetical protein
MPPQDLSAMRAAVPLPAACSFTRRGLPPPELKARRRRAVVTLPPFTVRKRAFDSFFGSSMPADARATLFSIFAATISSFHYFIISPLRWLFIAAFSPPFFSLLLSSFMLLAEADIIFFRLR